MDTLQDLMNQVRERLNIEGSPHVSENELKRYMKYSLAELYEKIIQSNEQWNVKRITFNVDNNPDGYKLPEDFYRPLVIGRLVDVGSQSYYPLARVNIRDESYFNSNMRIINYSGVSGYGIEVNDGYHYLRVVPYINGAGQYNAIYYPHLKDYDLNDIVVMGERGQHWEEYAILDVCIKICMKDETDPSGFILQKQAVINRIDSAAAARDAGQTEPPPIALPWWNKYGYGW